MIFFRMGCFLVHVEHNCICEVVALRFTGLPLHPGSVALQLPFGPIVKLQSSNPYGLLISHIKNGEKNYIIIVSKDFQNNQTVYVELAPGGSVVTFDTKSMDPDLGNLSMNLDFEPSGIHIFEW